MFILSTPHLVQWCTRFHLDAVRGTLPADEDDYQVCAMTYNFRVYSQAKQKVTVLSQDRSLMAVAGCHNVRTSGGIFLIFSHLIIAFSSVVPRSYPSRFIDPA